MPALPTPMYTKSRVNKAGDNIKRNVATQEDYDILENWRVSHAHVLNTFQMSLRRWASDAAGVAQRLKRRTTIIDKLTNRYKSMQLTRMNDIAGCRIICHNFDQMESLREVIRSKRIWSQLVHDQCKDYVQAPRESGYRGFHDIYRYKGSTKETSVYDGLLLELQYRTKVQHAWATAVELFGMVTIHKPKFGQAEQSVLRFFRIISELLARTYEGRSGTVLNDKDDELLKELKTIESNLSVRATLQGLTAAQNYLRSPTNYILRFSILQDSKLELKVDEFRTLPQALRKLSEYESVDSPKVDTVLVRASSSQAIAYAFQNYFMNAAEFLSLTNRFFEHDKPPKI